LVNYWDVQQAARPTKESIALECVGVLGRLAALFEERRRQLASCVGLTVQQWQVLEEVTQEHFMPSMFAQQRASSAAAVSKILRQLSDKGIIVAHVSEVDGRQRAYEVTPHGQKLLAKVRKERERAIGEVWLSLSRKELADFHTIGDALATKLQAWAETNRSNGTQ
jgi:DNA-binding MarR family transcriptional regulator